jgi:hypothetical protein
LQAVNGVVDSPLFKTVFFPVAALVIGGYGFKIVEHDRAMRDAARDKQIAVIQTITPDLNRAVSSMFASIREPGDDQLRRAFQEHRDKLYYNRFLVTTTAEIGPEPGRLRERYEDLTLEMSLTAGLLQRVGEAPLGEVDALLGAQLDRLLADWGKDQPDLSAETRDTNNPDLEKTVRDWARLAKEPDLARARAFYGRAHALAVLYFERSVFLLKDALRAAIKS